MNVLTPNKQPAVDLYWPLLTSADCLLTIGGSGELSGTGASRSAVWSDGGAVDPEKTEHEGAAGASAEAQLWVCVPVHSCRF